MGVIGAGCGYAKGWCEDDAAGCSEAISAIEERVYAAMSNGRCGVGCPAKGPRPRTDEPGQDRVSVAATGWRWCSERQYQELASRMDSVEMSRGIR